MRKIKIAIAGMGNCASSLLQGIEYYRKNSITDDCGLIHYDLGGYGPGDIELVAAFDVDERKVGKPAFEAIFAPPNNTMEICRDFEQDGPVVQMGPVLDGFSEHLNNYPPEQRFMPSDETPVDVAKSLRESEADILLNYMPVGSQKATEFYAEAALKANVAFINCIPVFIVSDPSWANKFKQKGLPCIGDDIKAQVGATIVHRVLTRLFCERGVQLKATYQLNTGGNTDFLNMLNSSRLSSKKISKTQAVQSQLDAPLDNNQVHIGPSDYVPWQKDNKVCFIRMEASGFAGAPMDLELRLSVQDSPNSAGVSIDAIRFCRIALDNNIAGPLIPVSAYFMKHPPQQLHDNIAREQVEQFLTEVSETDPEIDMTAENENPFLTSKSDA